MGLCQYNAVGLYSVPESKTLNRLELVLYYGMAGTPSVGVFVASSKQIISSKFELMVFWLLNFH